LPSLLLNTKACPPLNVKHIIDGFVQDLLLFKRMASTSLNLPLRKLSWACFLQEARAASGMEDDLDGDQHKADAQPLKRCKKPENNGKVLIEVRVGGLSDANPVLAFASRIARGVPKGRDLPLSLLPAWCSRLQRRDKE
jgi:hypothetical protein